MSRPPRSFSGAHPACRQPSVPRGGTASRAAVWALATLPLAVLLFGLLVEPVLLVLVALARCVHDLPKHDGHPYGKDHEGRHHQQGHVIHASLRRSKHHDLQRTAEAASQGAGMLSARQSGKLLDHIGLRPNATPNALTARCSLSSVDIAVIRSRLSWAGTPSLA